MNWRKLLLSPQGRIGRKSYWLWFGIMFGISALAAAIDAAMFESPKGEGPVSGLSSLAFIYPAICVQTKRLHDLGKSGWFQLLPFGFLLALVPFFLSQHTLAIGGAVILLIPLTLAYWIWVGFFPGVPGPNRFGELNSGDRDVAPVVEVFT